MERRTVDEMLSAARARLDRVAPSKLEEEIAAGALIVDTRPREQRERDGDLPGARVIDRNVLEWRLDPASPTRIADVTGPGVRIVIVCNEGYSSSLVAATLQDLGLRRATDLIGGFQAWSALQDREDDLMDRAEHWDRVYAGNAVTALSWFESEPSHSLALLDALGIESSASVVDIGAGASRFVDELLDRGFRDVTALDVAASGLAVAQRRLGQLAAQVEWVTADILAWQPGREFDVWHDRAVFHFLVDPAEQARYVEVVASSLRAGGRVVMATFAPDGPEQCSGLPVVRYDAAALGSVFGSRFAVVETRREQHFTPAGASQNFTWTALVRTN